jgi:hypothetical protein
LFTGAAGIQITQDLQNLLEEIMRQHKQGRIFASFLVLMILLSINADAQNLSKGLVFSEVYLDKDNYKNNWFEIYNPTDKPLVLNLFWRSYIRTPNLLPGRNNEIGGVLIEPGKHLIICLDKNQFKANWGNVHQVIEIGMIEHIPEGGFFIIGTKGLGKEDRDGFRFGNPEKSERMTARFGDQVIGFSRSGKSFTRRINSTESGYSVLDFIETIPTPGKSSN